jgi:hypothetical protein
MLEMLLSIILGSASLGVMAIVEVPVDLGGVRV